MGFVAGKTIACFTPLEDCMGPSGTLKASPQGGGFQDRSSPGSLDPVSRVHGVFSNRELPSTFGRQPRAAAITCND